MIHSVALEPLPKPQKYIGIMENKMETTIVNWGYIGIPYTPKVCKIMAFMAMIMGLGLLFYILLGFK